MDGLLVTKIEIGIKDDLGLKSTTLKVGWYKQWTQLGVTSDGDDDAADDYA